MRCRSPGRDSTILPKIATRPPSLRFLFAHPAHLVACGFGSGLSPFAPVTFGTLFAWASFLLFKPWLNELELAVLLLVCLLGGILAIHKTGADLGVVDHGSIVWDDGTRVVSSVNYVHQKDAHFHQAVADTLGLPAWRRAGTAWS